MNDIYSFSKTWINTPFRWRGFTHFGCDCSGLIIGVLNEMSILTNADFNTYKKHYYGSNLSSLNEEKIIKFILKYFIEIDKDLKNTSLLWLKTKNSPIHLAFYKNNKIIHSTRTFGVIEENLDTYQYQIFKQFKLKNE